jgi:hypothetical protein
MRKVNRDITDEEYRAVADADPVKLFYTLADLRMAGIEPREEGLVPHNPVTKKVKSPDRWAKQQIEGAIAASAKWLDGVQNPSRDPIAAGIEADDKWKDKIMQAVKEDRRKKGLAKVSHADIVKVATALGTGVYSSGVDARKDKIQKVVNELQPLVQSVSDAIQGMSDKTDADREKRLLAARKLMIEVGKKRRG